MRIRGNGIAVVIEKFEQQIASSKFAALDQHLVSAPIPVCKCQYQLPPRAVANPCPAYRADIFFCVTFVCGVLLKWHSIWRAKFCGGSRLLPPQRFAREKAFYSSYGRGMIDRSGRASL